jgi:PAS domain S-box-containing protein
LSRQQYDVPKRPSVTLFETRFWDACNTPVFDDQHNIIAILHTVTDVTAQVIAEQKIELNERRFKSLVQEGVDLIGILDATGIYSYVSPTSAAILDLSPEVFIGKCAFDFIHEEDRKKVSDQFGQLKQEHRIQIEPFRFLHGDGSWRWIETTLVNLLDDPSVNGIVANSRDVTGRIKYKQSLQCLNSELIRINQELKASNEDLEQFAFIASHDLQEPLRMISGFMTQLQRKYQADLDFYFTLPSA